MSHRREYCSDRGYNPNRRSASYSDEDSNYTEKFHQKYTKAQIENGLKFFDRKKLVDELKQKEIMLKAQEQALNKLQDKVSLLKNEREKLRESFIEAMKRGDKEITAMWLAALDNCVQVKEKTENLSKESSIKYLELKEQVEKVKNQIQLWTCQ